MSDTDGKQEGKSGMACLPQSQANLMRWLETSSIK